MATLFSQPVRDSFHEYDTENELEDSIKLSQKFDVPLEVVLEAAYVAQLRRANAMRVCDGDAKDEQLQGFGELAQELIGSIGGIAESIDTLARSIDGCKEELESLAIAAH